MHWNFCASVQMAYQDACVPVTGPTHEKIYTVLMKVTYQDVSHYNHVHT